MLRRHRLHHNTIDRRMGIQAWLLPRFLRLRDISPRRPRLGISPRPARLGIFPCIPHLGILPRRGLFHGRLRPLRLEVERAGALRERDTLDVREAAGGGRGGGQVGVGVDHGEAEADEEDDEDGIEGLLGSAVRHETSPKESRREDHSRRASD